LSRANFFKTVLRVNDFHIKVALLEYAKNYRYPKCHFLLDATLNGRYHMVIKEVVAVIHKTINITRLKLF
jgi:hypothetical protein